MRRLSVAHLTALQLPPPALIEAAAAAGFDAVGLRLIAVTPTTPGYPLMHDARMLRETKATLASTGLAVDDIEFVKITPDIDLDALEPVLDAGAELCARHIITAPYDDDLSRLSDRLAAIQAAARSRGLTAVLEFFPWTAVPDLATCRSVVEAADPDIGILVDSLHFNRSGSSLDDLATIPMTRLPFAHLCDAPVAPPYSRDELLRTAREDRLFPGEGDIPLKDLLAALPADIPLGLEVPVSRSRMIADPVKTLTRLREATLALLNR
ncbi:sugar phosphate isomerase/epimerase [Paracoccus sp. TK19116]|uniref:Sugar phosphate isomerase/epimerase n=1 Tax=Paracoccus albicereus TaxID=2922394 RepID=A0ABT1MUY1_9RHOB|nr:sugar phosphate isomerase/epimerase [Paracoccus albicereus]MCQ0972110.1 sugar phosphate isomerase/epimerase [Paracoccus albicereus]